VSENLFLLSNGVSCFPPLFCVFCSGLSAREEAKAKGCVEGRRGREKEDVLDDLRGNDLAGTAPGGEAVEDHQGVLFGEGGVKVGLTENMVSTDTRGTKDIKRDAVDARLEHVVLEGLFPRGVA